MKKLKFIIVAVLSIGLLFFTGCQTDGGEKRTYLAIEGLPPATGEDAPDDVVINRMETYRANVHEQGKENPWPPIETVTVKLGRSSDKVNLWYRNHIVTEAGETRNNILFAYKEDGFFEGGTGGIKLYTLETPSGLNLFQESGGGLPGTLVSVLIIEVPPDTEPGLYKLEIGLEIQGKDYGTIPCTIEVVEPTIEKSMVRVFEAGASESPVAFGIVVGDCNQVLTVLNYEEYTPTPGSLEVVAATGDRFGASVQAIDPRTSATLLRIEGANLPLARTGDSANMWQGQEVFVQGWKSGTTFKKASATINYLSDWPLSFQVWITDEAMDSGNAVSGQGAAITDYAGNVIGLAGVFYNSLIPILGGPGMMPPCVPINSALELLASDAATWAWTDGPAVTTRLSDSGATSVLGNILPSVSAYDQMTKAVQELLGTLGKRLDDDDELAQHYVIFASPPPTKDGSILLTLCYPDLQELSNIDGELLARAKWVGLQWNLSEGKPNRLFYGSEPYDPEGIFELTGDTVDLEKGLNLEH